MERADTDGRGENPVKFSKLIVTLVVILNILFTSVILYVFLRTGNEPAVLVGCWFAFTTGELFFLAKIKTSEGGE